MYLSNYYVLTIYYLLQQITCIVIIFSIKSVVGAITRFHHHQFCCILEKAM